MSINKSFKIILVLLFDEDDFSLSLVTSIVDVECTTNEEDKLINSLLLKVK